MQTCWQLLGKRVDLVRSEALLFVFPLPVGSCQGLVQEAGPCEPLARPRGEVGGRVVVVHSCVLVKEERPRRDVNQHRGAAKSGFNMSE